MNIPNRITPDAFVRMPIGEIAALPAEELARLQQETDEALRTAKAASAWLDGALTIKYADRAIEPGAGSLRRAQRFVGFCWRASSSAGNAAISPIGMRTRCGIGLGYSSPPPSAVA